jgi:flavodoxin
MRVDRIWVKETVINVASVVVYYSKSGNTKAVAELIADGLGCEALPVNLMEKKGRGTSEERDREKALYAAALRSASACRLVVVGTPTGFRKPKSMIRRFVGDVETEAAALFCTYENKIGDTLTDLEDTLRERGIGVAGTLGLDGLKPGAFEGLDDDARGMLLGRLSGFVGLCREELKRR